MTNTRIIRNRGFTLLEMSAVVVISGIILAAGLQLYRVHLAGQRVRDVSNQLNAMHSLLDAYASKHGFYPCPADPTHPLGHAQYNRASCPASGGTAVRVAGAPRDVDQDGDIDAADTAAISPVLIGIIPFMTLLDNAGPAWASGSNYVVNSVVAHLDAAGRKTYYTAKSIHVSSTASEPAVGGSWQNFWTPITDPDLSLRDLNDYSFQVVTASGSIFVDPWGRRFIYAVTEDMTDPAKTSTVSYGAINIATESGVSLVSPEGSASYVLLSAGENGAGAYNQQGALVTPCTAGQGDSTNCAASNTFIAGLRNLGAGVDYFDDVLYFAPMQKPPAPWTSVTTPSWQSGKMYAVGDYVSNKDNAGIVNYYVVKLAHGSVSANEPGKGASWATNWTQLSNPPQQVMYNTKLGSVGIGTAQPTDALDIVNLGQKGGLQAPLAQTENICDFSGNCFPHSFLSGPTLADPSSPRQNTCEAGKLMTGIVGGKITCEDMPSSLPITVQKNFTCPANQYIYQIDSAGVPKCKAL